MGLTVSGNSSPFPRQRQPDQTTAILELRVATLPLVPSWLLDLASRFRSRHVACVSAYSKERNTAETARSLALRQALILQPYETYGLPPPWQVLSIWLAPVTTPVNFIVAAFRRLEIIVRDTEARVTNCSLDDSPDVSVSPRDCSRKMTKKQKREERRKCI